MLFACVYVRETICYWSLFLSKQQIFSPGLLTRLVLIVSVAEDWGVGRGVGVYGDGRMGEGRSNYFSLLLFFCPKPFFTHMLLGEGGGSCL